MGQLAFGIDIGGSGIKGAPVNLKKGELAADRVRIPTPQPATPEAVAQTVRELIDSFDVPADMPVGITFPTVIQHGVAKTAANVDDSWIGTDADALFTKATGRDVFVVNDADAAGIAEMEFGAGKGKNGLVIMTTLGTGIGSAMFIDGKLIPNSELGHLVHEGRSIEKFAASSVFEREGLTYQEWAEKRLQVFYSQVEFLFSPDLILVGGGVSKQAKKFLPYLKLETTIVAAKLRNEAGIVGAAALAHANKKRATKKLAKAKKKRDAADLAAESTAD